MAEEFLICEVRLKVKIQQVYNDDDDNLTHQRNTHFIPDNSLVTI